MSCSAPCWRSLSRNHPRGSGAPGWWCDTCAARVTGSIIISALPWSAVMIQRPFFSLRRCQMRPRQASTASTARTVGSILPEWPTMSALAKFMTMTSKSFRPMASSTTLVTPSALISGFRSYVATLGDAPFPALRPRTVSPCRR